MCGFPWIFIKIKKICFLIFAVTMGKGKGKKAASGDGGKAAKRAYDEARERLKVLVQDHSAWDHSSQIASLAEMTSLLGKMDILQGLSSPIVDLEDDSGAILRFQEWMRLHNVQEGGGEGAEREELAWELKSAGADKGRGIFATRDIPYTEAVFKIHSSVMFTPSFGKATAGAGAGGDTFIQRALIELKDNEVVALATALAHHASCPTSFFRPYIDILPRRYGVASYWPSALLREVVDPKVRSRLIGNVRAQGILYLRVCNTLTQQAQAAKSAGEGRDLPPLLDHGLPWDLFRWAMATVSSRQNSIPLVDCMEDGSEVSKGSALALVPGWDMMNHRLGPMTTDFNTDTSSLIFYPMSDTIAGDEICMCYGSRSNHELLIYSGFVSEGNTNDELVIEAQFPQDELSPMRRLILKAMLGGGDLLASGRPAIDVGLRIERNDEFERDELCAKAWAVLIAVAARKDELALVLSWRLMSLPIAFIKLVQVSNSTAYLFPRQQATVPKNCLKLYQTLDIIGARQRLFLEAAFLTLQLTLMRLREQITKPTTGKPRLLNAFES